MDTMAALALGTEAPTLYAHLTLYHSLFFKELISPLHHSRALLDRPPAGRNYPLISSIMWRNILGQGLYQLIVLFGILYGSSYILENDDEIIRNTFLFNSFVFCQVPC